MSLSNETDARELTLASEMRGLWGAVLASMPGGSALVFDHELRVHFAQGDERPLAGAIVGRRLSDVMATEVWDASRQSYEAAIAGNTTSFHLDTGGSEFSVDVSPICLPGRVRGGLAVSRAATGQPSVVPHPSGAEPAPELFRSAFDRAPIGMAVIGLDGRWLHANDAWCEMLGYSRQEMIGATLAEFMHPDDAAEDGLFASRAGARHRTTTERRYVHKDGHAVWVDIGSEMVSDQYGNPLYVVAHLQDISERRTAEASRRASDRLLHAIIDNTPAVITVKGRDHRYQLVNRQFEEWCGVSGHLVLGCSAEEMPWGHLAADGRAKDQLVLDGGERFQEEESVMSAGRPRVFLTSRFPLLNEQGDINAICTTSTDITERREEERTKHERLQCSAQVHAALSQDRFVLYGQPIINLASMRVEQAELLLRMRTGPGETELIAPGEFLPAAERFGLIGLIDEWVVDRAVQFAAAGHRVEVNLSAKTISDVRLVDRIERAVLDSGAAPGNLIFEITETAVADHLDAAREFAQRLRKLGCAFALDDFGVGHGTFTYLKHLSLDYLKIDLQFVRDLLSDDSDGNVVCAIIGVARQFGIKTIAEGVEDQATLLELQRIGVDYAQGYWIGRPEPVAQMWNPTSSK